MPLAKIDITIPEALWIADVSAAHPEVTFRIVSTQYDDGTATGLFEIEGDQLVSILAGANDADNVTELELLWKTDQKAIVQIETDNPLLLLPVSRVGVPLQTPFVISDGIASWELFTTHSKLSALTDEFDTLGITYDVSSIKEFQDEQKRSLLTPRQEEVLEVAYEVGYYDTPREATLTQVATSLDISKATGSDLLHRAEGKIIDRFINLNIRS